MSRSQYAIRSAVIASAVTAGALLGATTAFAAGAPPHITDPAGDATYALVLNDNYADLLAADATLSTSSLTLTETVAAVRSAATNDYVVEINRSGAHNGTQLVSTVTAASATLQVSDFGGPNSVAVTGTASYDSSRGTVSAVYSRAAINAALTRTGKARLGASDQVTIEAVSVDRALGASDSASGGDSGQVFALGG